jgi:hypothetical protein
MHGDLTIIESSTRRSTLDLADAKLKLRGPHGVITPSSLHYVATTTPSS